MLSIQQWKWQSGHTSGTDDGEDSSERVMGIAASGLDLVAGLMIRLQRDAAESVGQYRFQSAALHDVGLRPQNQCALALLRDWLAEPDELGEAWWAEFEQDLQHHRLAFREIT